MNLTLSQLFTRVVMGIAIALSLSLVAVPATVQAQNNPADAACEGLRITGGECGDEAEGTIGNIVRTVINILSLIVGAVSVIMIIIGGFKYIISSGDSNNVQSAKNTILYAIIGLVIVIFAQVIVGFVVNRVSP